MNEEKPQKEKLLSLVKSFKWVEIDIFMLFPPILAQCSLGASLILCLVRSHRHSQTYTNLVTGQKSRMT